MAKKTLKCGMTFSVSPEVKAWWDAKREKGFNLSAIFGRIMAEAIAREARTGDWLAHDNSQSEVIEDSPEGDH